MKVEIHTVQVGQTWRDDYNIIINEYKNKSSLLSTTLITLVTHVHVT